MINKFSILFTFACAVFNHTTAGMEYTGLSGYSRDQRKVKNKVAMIYQTQTEEKLKKDNISTKQQANTTHHTVGVKVRSAIKEIGGIMPEDLPAAENIKKIERKSNKELPE